MFDDPKIPREARDALRERVEGFKKLLAYVETALKGSGGGDESLVASAWYSYRMLMAEVMRLNAARPSPSQGSPEAEPRKG